MDDRVTRLHQLKNKLHLFRAETEVVAQSLRDVAKEFQKDFLTGKKVTMGGSVAGVVGGILAAVGLGLTPVTFGASLILTAVGAAIGASGGVTSLGAFIGESFYRNKTVKKAQEIINQYEQTRNDILTAFADIIEELEEDDVEKDGLKNRFALLGKFLTLLVDASSEISVSDACDLIRKTASAIKQGGTPASVLAIESAAAAGRIASSATKVTCAVTRGIRVAGGVVGIVLIPIDIAFLVHSAHAVKTDKVPDTSKTIMDTAARLLEMCPSEELINDMVNDTIKRLKL